MLAANDSDVLLTPHNWSCSSGCHDGHDGHEGHVPHRRWLVIRWCLWHYTIASSLHCWILLETVTPWSTMACCVLPTLATSCTWL